MRTIGKADRFDFNGDHEAFADWMLRVVDKSPDRMGMFPMPTVEGDEIDALEEDCRRAYNIAKAQRRDLSVKVLHALDERDDPPQSRILLVVHEHRWVGGQCVNGCPDARKVG